jgi:Polyketide cyclase / dehydrase and lipid transport
MSSSYDFVTRWSVAAPLEAVWKEISEADRWPSWWPGVVAVQLLEPGDADGVGAYRRFTWRSRLPYTLRFNMRTTRVEKLHVIEGVADGELSGFGRWQLIDAGSRVDVRYDWRVDANKAWMRMLAPVARPLFAWNHDVVMRWGQEGLTKVLSPKP